MTAIRYDVITGNYYSAEKGVMLYPNGFPDGVLKTVTAGDPRNAKSVEAKLPAKLIAPYPAKL